MNIEIIARKLSDQLNYSFTQANKDAEFEKHKQYYIDATKEVVAAYEGELKAENERLRLSLTMLMSATSSTTYPDGHPIFQAYEEAKAAIKNESEG